MRFFRWSPLLAVLASTPSLANDDWWFDVEVIVFERKVAMSALEEQFDLADSLAVPATDADVIGAVITPDISMLKQGIAVCGETNALEWPEFDYFASASAETNTPYGSSESSETTNAMGTTSQKPAHSGAYPNAAIEQFPSNDAYAGRVSSSQLSSSQTNFADELNSSVDNGLSAEEIAGYWAEFLGLDKTETIRVPNQPYCVVHKPWLSYYDSKWHIHRPDNRLPAPKELPITPEGNDWPYASHAHLLTKNEQEMASLSRQIRQNRDLTRLLHVTWRQPVKFGKDEAFNVRLFAGNNFSDEFDQDGVQRPPVPPMRFASDSYANSSQNNVDSGSSADSNPGSNSGSSNGTTNSFGDNSYQSLYNKQQNQQLNEQPSFNGSLANENYSDESMASGMGYNQASTNSTSTDSMSSDFFYDLDARLASPTPILFKDLLALDNADVIDDADESNISAAFRAPIWKVDGNIKVFLKYINRVPYLHIDSELFYRQPIPVEGQTASSSTSSTSRTDSSNVNATPEYQLVSLPFSEQRRVISNQLHYFDHPLFGMVVQIRRYKRPNAPED
ncbi:CsiV family protein [Alteromonas sp. 1_MG-2023]|uniref:CsiV family protein n=1 Tax=Alteromonas sp. 1_MG-2023 TaxID=3062669 RepID=UPI0026E1E892|nr:CsiV family protein [Alteromonas sp. 1_MG-2023]MDO6567518.1 CsiV family protein [Alteromonas sp. 1_MG-2023]